MAAVPVFNVGWMTGANFGEWLAGISLAIRPAASASRHCTASMPPNAQ